MWLYVAIALIVTAVIWFVWRVYCVMVAVQTAWNLFEE